MKKIAFFTILASIILSACGGLKADVPDNMHAKAAQALIQEWMAAVLKNDIQKLGVIYADDLVWMDHGDRHGPLDKENYLLSIQVAGPDAMKLKFKAYVVTIDGHSAVVQSTYSAHSRSTQKWVSMPAYAVLEFNDDGKITRETWYYNSDPLY